MESSLEADKPLRCADGYTLKRELHTAKNVRLLMLTCLAAKIQSVAPVSIFAVNSVELLPKLIFISSEIPVSRVSYSIKCENSRA